MHKKAMEMAKCAMADACAKGYDNMTSQDWDDFKDCMEVVEKAVKADYYYHIVEAMEEAQKEDEEEAKYIMKKMKEEYGDEEGERRFYDNYRYKSSGRFAPKGRGSYMPIRGYDESMHYGMMPQVHNPMEWDRDMDRMDGKMYYSGGGQSTGGNSGGQSNGGSSSGMGGNASMRDGREGRSGMSRRSYMETKEIHKDNSPESKQAKMRELEEYAKELAEDVTEMISDATPEEKALLKQKMQVLMQKI